LLVEILLPQAMMIVGFPHDLKGIFFLYLPHIKIEDAFSNCLIFKETHFSVQNGHCFISI